jgi:hypothetical protein
LIVIAIAHRAGWAACRAFLPVVHERQALRVRIANHLAAKRDRDGFDRRILHRLEREEDVDDAKRVEEHGAPGSTKLPPSVEIIPPGATSPPSDVCGVIESNNEIASAAPSPRTDCSFAWGQATAPAAQQKGRTRGERVRPDESAHLKPSPVKPG